MTNKKLFWTAANLLNDLRPFTAVVDYCDELYADGVHGLTKEDCDKCGEEYHFHGQCVMCETYNNPYDRERRRRREEEHKIVKYLRSILKKDRMYNSDAWVQAQRNAQ